MRNFKKRYVTSALVVILVVFCAYWTKTMIQAGASADVLFQGRSEVSIIVRDNLNLAVPNAQVTVANEAGASQTMSEPNAAGIFTLRARAGAYTLTATATGYISETETIDVDFSDKQEVIIYLSPEI